MSEQLSAVERAAVDAFLASLTYQGPSPLNGYGYHGVTREQYWESYPSWARGGDAWNRLKQGGTGIMAALCWYQHIHKPGSHEWRPSIIVRALVAHAMSVAASEPREPGDNREFKHLLESGHVEG